MKKSLIALAALTAFAGAASAQSSVTLFGVVDLNARQIENNDSRFGMGQDGNASSRLGFRGVEDLGGGLRAGFWIEGGISADTGTAGGGVGNVGGVSTVGLWNRRATVSLISNMGELRLGRDYVPDFWNHTVYDPFGTNGVGSSVNIFGTFNSAGTLVRANNSIGYFLPAMGGFFGQVMYAAGEEQNGNEHMAGRLGYAAGPFSMAVAYGKTESRLATPAIAANPAAVPPVLAVPAYTQGDWTRINVGGSFNLGFATLMGQYALGEGSGGPDDGKEQALWMIGGSAPIGALTLKLSYTSSDSSGGSVETRDATQLAVGAVYDLSKRTAIYGHYAKIDNDAGASYRVGTVGDALTHTLSAGKGSSGFEVGVKHSF